MNTFKTLFPTPIDSVSLSTLKDRDMVISATLTINGSGTITYDFDKFHMKSKYPLTDEFSMAIYCDKDTDLPVSAIIFSDHLELQAYVIPYESDKAYLFAFDPYAECGDTCGFIGFISNSALGMVNPQYLENALLVLNQK